MLKTVFEGEQTTHLMLWGVAKEQASEALKRTEGYFSPSVIARVFAYHTVEAYLNYVGEKIAPDIWKDEQKYFQKQPYPYRGALGKLRWLMNEVGLVWTPNDRPLKTILELKEIRDLIAHGKVEKLDGVVVHPTDTNAPPPVSKLRELIAAKGTLALVLPDVEEFLDAIQIHAKPLLKKRDVWFGDKALQGTPMHRRFITTRKD